MGVIQITPRNPHNVLNYGFNDMNFKSKIAKGGFFGFAAFLISLLIIISPNGFVKFVNGNTENFYSDFSSETKVDTNIILIEISHSDIEQLGAWPIKRSYYALLFNYLNKLKPATIGFGIFLSTNSQSQTIYNKLLSKEIAANNNIVLSSLASGLNLQNKIVKVDSFIFPVPKLDNKNIITGHLGYFYSNGILIPLAVKKNNTVEYAFSQEIAHGQNANVNQLVKLNPFKNYSEYKKFSLLQFLRLAESNSSKLQIIKNKIVIIGVTDPSIITNIVLPSGNSISGIMLQAIAVDNLINKQTLNFNYLNLSGYVFLLMVLLLIFLRRKTNPFVLYATSLILFLIVTAVLFNSYFIEYNYAFFIIPFLFIVLAEIPLFIIHKDKQLAETISETEILKNLLTVKEGKLAALELEIKNGAIPSAKLSSEIELLKKQIDDFRKREEDNKLVEFSNDADGNNFNGIIYRSKKMAALVNIIEKVAPQKATVLIMGETGSGKELVAKAVHKLSTRRNNKFIAINCAAISDSLLESELFGHKKGAFTNAVADKKGMFEAADKGTIFLDEIGETSESFQVKLLRVLQSGEIQKVGSVESKTVDVRIVAATNKNLKKLVAEKTFREDLFYRLNVITIEIPPLRERKEDIELLVKYFVEKEGSGLKISKGVLSQLIAHQWKGNVRELESVISRASIFAKGENRNIIKLCDLPEGLAKLDKTGIGNLILDSLREKDFSHSSINETAKELGGLSRTSVSEHYRGMFFKEFVSNNFDFDKAVRSITQTNRTDVNSKVIAKGKTYLNNIEKDLLKLTNREFEFVKEKFNTKYKNLPNQYHVYLDKVIKYTIDNNN